MPLKLLVLSLCVLAVAGVPTRDSRIVGGAVTNIQRYPFAVVLLSRQGNNYRHSCGGTIINNRSVLTAAHCFANLVVSNYRVRVGSTYSNSGGVVHNTQRIVNHYNYNLFNMDNDCSVLRISGSFRVNNNVRYGSFAGSTYYLRDNEPVWAIGWGATYYRGPWSTNLRHVELRTVNQGVCRQRYATRRPVTDNMLCSGWLNVGGRDTCQGDSGGPLLHHGVVVGITSFGQECAHPNYPGVYARMTRMINWVNGQA